MFLWKIVLLNIHIFITSSLFSFCDNKYKKWKAREYFFLNVYFFFLFLFLFLLWNFLDLFKDLNNCWRNRNSEHVQSYLYLHEIWRKKKKYQTIEMKEEKLSQRRFFKLSCVLVKERNLFQKKRKECFTTIQWSESSSHRCVFCVFNSFMVFLWQGLPGLLLNIYKLSVFISFCNRESHSHYIALEKITFFSFLWTFLFLATFSTS